MKNLFIIDGAAGTGKNDMIDYIKQKYSRGSMTSIVFKYTTRKKRKEEKERKLPLDLIFISKSKFNAHKKNSDFYSYEYGGEYYGFYRNSIDEAIQNYKNIFVIIRDRVTIQHLIKDYPNVCTIPVFIYSDYERIFERLKKDDYDDEAIKFRLSRQELVWGDYLKQSNLYKEVIINNSCKIDFFRLIDTLILKYNIESNDLLNISNTERFKIVKPLIGYKDEVIKRLKKYPYNRNVFLMMKFRKENNLLFKFIKENLENNGFNCVRSDQIEWGITKNFYNPIAVLYCCKYGIALFDRPEKNNTFSPNVAYELGMMHLQGKDCLILRHTTLPNMPFDLIGDLHVPYKEDLEVQEIIKDWIENIK